jgi:PAS domain S-box-containing protein
MDARIVHFEPELIGDLLDIIHNAIIVINSENRIIFANSRTVEMFKASTVELLNNEFSKLFMPDDTEIMVANILHITRNDREFEGEAMLRRPDGTTFLGMISGTYFQWDNSQEGMAFSIHDLTDMKAIEHSLRHSERSAFLGRLVNDISHQIRNPVMVIGGFARRLNTEGSSSKKVKAIIDETSRLEQLLDTLNNFISLRCPDPERLPIGDLIDMAETALRSKVEAYGCNWVSEYEEDIAGEELLVDKDLMVEALEVVIANACESYNGNAEGNVAFHIHHSNDPALPYVISIIDYGGGISREISPYVFDHFYSTKTRHMGMGLTLARRIVEEQRGALTIASKVGEGSTVSFHLVKERRRPLRTIKL